MLITLRELQMSISEIEQYMAHRSISNFKTIVNTKLTEIDHTIDRLTEIKMLLEEKQQSILTYEQLNPNQIELIDCPEEYLLLSPPICGTFAEEDLAILIDHTQSLRDCRLFNKSYGSMLPTSCMATDDFDSYECYFIKLKENNPNMNLFIKPGGKYIRDRKSVV